MSNVIEVQNKEDFTNETYDAKLKSSILGIVLNIRTKME